MEKKMLTTKEPQALSRKRESKSRNPLQNITMNPIGGSPENFEINRNDFPSLGEILQKCKVPQNNPSGSSYSDKLKSSAPEPNSIGTKYKSVQFGCSKEVSIPKSPETKNSPASPTRLFYKSDSEYSNKGSRVQGNRMHSKSNPTANTSSKNDNKSHRLSGGEQRNVLIESKKVPIATAGEIITQFGIQSNRQTAARGKNPIPSGGTHVKNCQPEFKDSNKKHSSVANCGFENSKATTSSPRKSQTTKPSAHCGHQNEKSNHCNDKQQNESIDGTTQAKSKKKRKGKVKRLATLQAGKVTVLSAEVHSKIVQQSADALTLQNSYTATDINDTQEFPELGGLVVPVVNKVAAINIEHQPSKKTPVASVKTDSVTESDKVTNDSQLLSADDNSHTPDPKKPNQHKPTVPVPEKERNPHTSNRKKLSLFDMIRTTKKPKVKELDIKADAEVKHNTKFDFKARKQMQSQVINFLDSSRPIIKRGKEREKPKAKKTSQLKKIILMDRKLRKQNQSNRDGEDQDNNNLSDAADEDNTVDLQYSDENEFAVELEPQFIHESENPETISYSPSTECEELTHQNQHLYKNETAPVDSISPNPSNLTLNCSIDASFDQSFMESHNSNSSTNCSLVQSSKGMPDVTVPDENNTYNEEKSTHDIANHESFESESSKEFNMKNNTHYIEQNNTYCYPKIELSTSACFQDSILCSDENVAKCFSASQTQSLLKSVPYSETMQEGQNNVKSEEKSGPEKTVLDISLMEIINTNNKDNTVINSDCDSTSSVIDDSEKITFCKSTTVLNPLIDDFVPRQAMELLGEVDMKCAKLQSIFGAQNMSDSSNIGSLDVKRLQATKVLTHTKKFREYCNHFTSKDIDAAVVALLSDLVRFQDRMHEKNPIKARIKRRLICGIKEIKKHMKLKKLKCIIIAADIENVKAEGGLNDLLNELKSLAETNHIPCIFSLQKYLLGKLCHKPVPVSCVGVFSYDGSEKNFKEIIELQGQSKQDYTEFIGSLASKLRNEQIEELLRARSEAPEKLYDLRISILREHVIFAGNIQEVCTNLSQQSEKCVISDSYSFVAL